MRRARPAPRRPRSRPRRGVPVSLSLTIDANIDANLRRAAWGLSRCLCGQVMTHYDKIFERLLRLRQLCCHPALLPKTAAAEGAAGAAGATAGGAGVAVARLVELMEERMAGGDAECCVCLDDIAEPVITKSPHRHTHTVLIGHAASLTLY